ncbi:MAG TPA: universal stress protein [Steroidobacteraceae bacterium]|jgi:universal stress protein E
MNTKHWRTIMVVVTNPFAREQLAAAKAAAAARRCGARVVLFNTFMIPQPVVDVPMDSREAILASAIRQRRAALRSIASGLRLPADTECVVRWDYPIDEAIVRQVRKTKPDLLITESHRHGRLARLLLANTDWLLIRDCPCPLWFVRSQALPKSPRVLVAVDPRHAHAKPAKLDDRLLRAATGFTQQLGGRIGVVHVYQRFEDAEPGLLRRPLRARQPSEEVRRQIATTNELVTKLAEKHNVGANRCAVLEGTTEEMVAREAERLGADVLVMGAVSRSLLARPVIGNTAERVIDRVECDVFVVKPPGLPELDPVIVASGRPTRSARTGRRPGVLGFGVMERP